MGDGWDVEAVVEMIADIALNIAMLIFIKTINTLAITALNGMSNWFATIFISSEDGIELEYSYIISM